MTASFMPKYRGTGILFGVTTALGIIDIISGLIFGFLLLKNSNLTWKHMGDFAYQVPADWFVAIPALYVIVSGIFVTALGRAGQIFIARVNTNLEMLFLMKQRQDSASESDKEKEPPQAN